MSDLVAPTSPTAFPLPLWPGQDETVWMQTQRGTAEYFRLWSLPVPTRFTNWPADGGRAYMPRRRTQKAGLGYRIAYPTDRFARGYGLARFRLEEGHTQHSLKVLCDHLDSVGASWLWLTDANGARLNERLFFTHHHASAA